MKRRILNFFAALITTVIGVNAQTLSVADTHMDAGWFGNITVNISGATEMTALQFNLALPEGVSLGDITKGEYIKPGEAANSHMYSVSNLPSGDLLIVVYNLNLKTFKDGVLMRIPVNTADDLGESAGRIYNVRTSTVDAVSHKCSEATFKVIPKVSLTVDKASATLTTGETLRLNAEVWPTNLAVEWTSSDESVATVENGVVTAVAAGTATITAKAGDKEATCVVTVEAAAVEPEPEPEPTPEPASVAFTFTRDADVAVNVEGIEGVTASIEAAPAAYLTTAAAANDSILCINQNTSTATADNPNKYTLTITNNSGVDLAFDYINVCGVALNSTGNFQGVRTVRDRVFVVSYGDNTLAPATMRICDDSHCSGVATVNTFEAADAIPASSTYVIGVSIYTDGGAGCFYGLTRITLGKNEPEGGDVTNIESPVLEAQDSQLIYDLQGRRVEKMEKGVYIVNGKKVIMK